MPTALSILFSTGHGDFHIWVTFISEHAVLAILLFAACTEVFVLTEAHCIPVAGLQQRARQEPSFTRSVPSFGNRGAPGGGEFIVRGADGRGGRATVLRPHNRVPASAQVLCLPCISINMHMLSPQDCEHMIQSGSACHQHPIELQACRCCCINLAYETRERCIPLDRPLPIA